MRRLAAVLVSAAVALSSVSLTAVTPIAEAAPAARAVTEVRIATFNVRTARATSDKRSWLERVDDVAGEILARRPGVVLLQELGPGRADGKKGKIKGAARQTTSLTAKLADLGASEYRLTRTTSYFKQGTPHGTQGARILYDSSRYTLVNRCHDYTGTSGWHRSCGFDLPVMAGDSKKKRRSAALAHFRDRRTGAEFWVVSAHLDHRHSKSDSTEAKLNRLRARQAAAAVAKVARYNTANLPVFFGGDINAWQTDRGRYAPHRALRARGFVDAVTAARPINYAYPTVNHFKETLKKSKNPKGAPRLDVVMAKGSRGATRYENKTQRVDRTRPSDHNMVVGDFLL